MAIVPTLLLSVQACGPWLTGYGVRACVGVAWARPEPHVLLFRRPHGTDPVTGKVDPFEAEKVRKEILAEQGPLEAKP
jgi:hypothetical protein